jgi:hypothetical protein
VIVMTPTVHLADRWTLNAACGWLLDEDAGGHIGVAPSVFVGAADRGELHCAACLALLGKAATA